MFIMRVAGRYIIQHPSAMLNFTLFSCCAKYRALKSSDNAPGHGSGSACRRAASY